LRTGREIDSRGHIRSCVLLFNIKNGARSGIKTRRASPFEAINSAEGGLGEIKRRWAKKTALKNDQWGYKVAGSRVIGR